MKVVVSHFSTNLHTAHKPVARRGYITEKKKKKIEKRSMSEKPKERAQYQIK